MKSIAAIFIATTISCAAFAAKLAPEDAKALEARATKISAAFDAADVDATIAMTHPSLFALAGGRDKAIVIIESAMSQLRTMGVQVIESSLGVPTEVHSAADELVCFYPRTTVMRVGEKKAKSTGFLICVRKTAGGEWLFLDGSGLRENPSMLKMLLPALPEDVKFPDNKVELIQ